MPRSLTLTFYYFSHLLDHKFYLTFKLDPESPYNLRHAIGIGKLSN